MSGRVITCLDGCSEGLATRKKQRPVRRVAAYARVSTDLEDQQTSLEAQTDYYQKLIAGHPEWELAQIYVDNGISGVMTKNRSGFNQMLADCESGSVDLILTKSVSRFARNTLDSITVIRKLKEKGIGIYFEKEAIFTLDSKGEFLITLMSSFAQEESRSISENVTWGKRKSFADGKVSVPYGRFLGYDKGGNKYEMDVNPEQAKIVRRIYAEFLKGYPANRIAKHLMNDGVAAPGGGEVWYKNTVKSILQNEKYKGDALLQKVFTTSYLTKKKQKNEGQLPQYYVKNDHEAIIAPWIFDYVQKKILEQEDAEGGRYLGVGVWNGKIICGKCKAFFGPRPWHSTSYNNKVWQCNNRYNKKVGCKTHNIYDKLLHYVIHDAARTLLKERGVDKTVTEVLAGILPEKRRGRIYTAAGDFFAADIRTLLSDEDDLAVMIKSMTMTEDRSLRFLFIDNTEFAYKLPLYSPKRGIYYDD